jgi:hypothetical protein
MYTMAPSPPSPWTWKAATSLQKYIYSLQYSFSVFQMIEIQTSPSVKASKVLSMQIVCTVKSLREKYALIACIAFDTEDC